MPSDAQHYGVYQDDFHSQVANDLMEDDGPWFISEFLPELPLLIGAAARMIFRINRQYWSHVWCFVVGWQTALSAQASCEEQGPKMKYCFAAMVAFLLLAWQRKMVSMLVPFCFVMWSSRFKYVMAAFAAVCYAWQRKQGTVNAGVSMGISFIFAFVLRFLLLVGGPLHTVSSVSHEPGSRTSSLLVPPTHP